MIDNIFVSPAVHMAVGSLVILTNLIFLITAAWLVWQKKEFTSLGGFFFVLFQATLMLQVLIGIKLLDQGLGPLQLYIHYLGGLAPLAFCLIYYWLPTPEGITKSRRLLVIAIASFLFVLLTFTVGSMYTP